MTPKITASTPSRDLLLHKMLTPAEASCVHGGGAMLNIGIGIMAGGIVELSLGLVLDRKWCHNSDWNGGYALEGTRLIKQPHPHLCRKCAGCALTTIGVATSLLGIVITSFAAAWNA